MEVRQEPPSERVRGGGVGSMSLQVKDKMSELKLRKRGGEKSKWRKVLLADMENWETIPTDIQMLVGGGVIFVFSTETNRLIIELMHVSEEKPALFTVGDCLVRFLADDNEMTDVEHGWLENMRRGLENIPPDVKEEWHSYLEWATLQMKRTVAKLSENRTTQGEELLIRLLEPCQARCSFCICRSAQPDMVSSSEDIEERLVDGKKAGYKAVVFTGGEPTLIRDLPQLLKRAKELGYKKIGLQSNGIKLAKYEYAKELVDAGLNYVLQSLHSHDPVTHESIFKIEGCFDDCVQSVKNLMDLNIIVALNYVTTKQNVNGHEDFVRFVHKSFGRKNMLRVLLRGSHPTITFSSMSPQGWGEKNLQDLPQLSAVAPSVKRAIDTSRKLGVQVRIPGLCGFPACFLPDRAPYFDELMEREVVSIDARQYFPQCDMCAFRNKCSGYWKGYAGHFGASEFIPARPEDGFKLPDARAHNPLFSEFLPARIFQKIMDRIP